MPRVAFVIDTLEIGGAERSVVALASNLSNFEAGVITLYRGQSLASSLTNCAYFEAGQEPAKYAWRRVAARLESLVRLHRPDILHSMLFRSDQVVRVVGNKLGVPVVNSIVSDSYGIARASAMSGADRFKLGCVQAVDRVTSPLVDAFVANSTAVAVAAIRDLHLQDARVTVVPRGRDLSRFRRSDAADRIAARERLGIDSGARVTVTVGRLIPSKQHALILDAFAAARSMMDLLVIVGDGPERGRLVARAVELDVLQQVRFLGTRDDVDCILRAADLFAFASTFEGSPGAVIEALATGLPCVLVDIPPVRELVGDEAAFFFAPGDVRGCLRAFHDVFRLAPVERARIGDSARAAAERFSIEAMVGGHEAVYRRVVGGRR